MYSGQNPGFRACTSGLKPLFSARSTPPQILDALCTTLIKPPGRPAEDAADRWWLGLHVVSTRQPLRAEWLPGGLEAEPEGPRTVYDKYRQKRAYRGDGIGRVWGTDLSRLKDDAGMYRADLKTAMRIEAEEEGLSHRDKPWWEVEKELKRRNKGKSPWGSTWADSGKTKKELKGWKKETDRGQHRDVPHTG